MDKKRRTRVIETGKSILIVALTCSAFWLAARTSLMEPLKELLGEENPTIQVSQAQSQERGGAARPLRILANLGGGARYAAQYDEAGADSLFQQTAALLVETLTGSSAPEEISRRQWENALTETGSVCFDFQGEIPLQVLTGWLSGESSRQTAVVRRLALSVQGDWVDLYYRDETDGRYFRCKCEMVEASRLLEVLAALSGNGAYYAFEAEEYSMLDPDTMLLNRIAPVASYVKSNPVPSGQGTLEQLSDELGFVINPNGIYYAGEWVARSGDDTLRLSDDGTLTYLAEDYGGEHFPVTDQGAAGPLFNVVESCRRLASALMENRSGQARLYLMSVQVLDGEWEIQFGYSLNGIPVRMERGCAARFRVRGEWITQFELRIQNYADSGSTQTVLPARQAAAALEAKGLAGAPARLHKEAGVPRHSPPSRP